MLALTTDAKSLSTLSRGVPVQQEQERVLFALSTNERHQFFPCFQETAVRPASAIWGTDIASISDNEWVDYLREIRPTILVSGWSTPRVPEELLFTDDLPLRYICHTGGSVKKVVPRAFVDGGGLVTNWGTLVSHAVAEHALLLVLACLRNLPSWHPKLQSENVWGNSSAFKTRTLRGKKIGIHGFGSIARELIELLKPFRAECMVYSKNVPDDYIKQSGAMVAHDLSELFSTNDIVVECEALTPETEGIITDELLSSMPDDSVFINVARGAIVDEEALIELVREGRIRVGSDVFQREPLPEHSAFYQCKNVIVSPHIAGPTSECLARCGDFAIDNLKRFLMGQELESVVNLEVYDRST